MPNPFTQFLKGTGSGSKLDAFIERWDLVEELVIRTYRKEDWKETDQQAWLQARAWLLKEYPHFMEALSPLWAGAAIAGEPAGTDPFLAILSSKNVADFKGNWRAMQTLPAAREALNRLLLAR